MGMEKKIIYDQNALEELNQFSREVQKHFAKRIVLLETYGRLEFPDARKVTRDIFEIRVSQEGVYRGFYAYIDHPDVVILHFFQKKTNETPSRNIKLAERRLRKYA